MIHCLLILKIILINITREWEKQMIMENRNYNYQESRLNRILELINTKIKSFIKLIINTLITSINSKECQRKIRLNQINNRRINNSKYTNQNKNKYRALPNIKLNINTTRKHQNKHPIKTNNHHQKLKSLKTNIIISLI